ncbi:MAG: rane protein [Candidatus Saccharibacteria bacterium]|nr:rane protein [Candidatus Saccharibacteria bacterium]
MIKKIKSYLLVAAVAFMGLVPVAVPAVASAAANGCSTNIAGQIATGANEAAGSGGAINCTGGPDSATSGITNLARSLVNIFSIIVGVAAVIMIIYGGFRYITSGGDSGSVGNAKNTLIYAIVGLIIVALAQVIVRFVLTSTSTIT